MTPDLDIHQSPTLARGQQTVRDQSPPTAPPYEPPAIVYRAPLETTAAFCAEDFGGKQAGTCDGPINS